MTLPTTKPNARDLDWYVRECESLDERNKMLEAENAELREKFATIPDEVWSKADLVKQIHQALAERDDENQKNAALRSLLQDSLEWLDDYGIRMLGTSNLVSRIEIALRKEAQP